MNTNDTKISPSPVRRPELEKPPEQKPSQLKQKLSLLFGGRPETSINFVVFLSAFLALGFGAIAFFRLNFALGTALSTAVLTLILLNAGLLFRATIYLAAALGIALAGLILGLLGYGLGSTLGGVLGALAGIVAAAASYHKIIRALNKVN